MNVKLDKQQRLDDLQAKVLSDEVCRNLAEQATQLVFGDGNPDADIVVIGEAPGKNEDIQGKPFVGAAGKFLNEMLDSINLIREEIYITNIVKYRPPNNRDPLPEEKRAFWPYLVRQLNVIQPKLVVTLGRHSMEYFLPEQKISQIHGQPKRIKLHMGSDELREKSNKKLAPQFSKDLDIAQGNSKLSKTGDQEADGVQEKRKETSTDLDVAQGSSKLSKTGDQEVDGVQGGEEKRKSRTFGTEIESRTSLTQQSAAKSDGITSFASNQDGLVLVVLPLYHPAAALYNGSMRQTLIDDFVRIPEIMKKIN